jgi:hypothetical protein
MRSLLYSMYWDNYAIPFQRPMAKGSPHPITIDPAIIVHEMDAAQQAQTLCEEF